MDPIAIERGGAVPQAPAYAVDAAALRRELEAAVTGEVRFDAVSRALYSTDGRPEIVTWSSSTVPYDTRSGSLSGCPTTNTSSPTTGVVVRIGMYGRFEPKTTL